MGDRASGSPDNKTPRLIAIGVLLSSFVLLYLVQLFSMQIINNVRFSQDATQISQKSLPISAKRGEIFDRFHDTPLVQNVDSFQISFNPAEAPAEQIPRILSRLSVLLKVTFSSLDQKVPASLYSSFQSIELKRGVDYPTVSQIAEHKEDFGGVTWESNPIRNYLNLGSLAHVIGYVGSINQEELQVLYNQGYGMRSVIGKSGIEKNFDLVLRGKEGTRFRTVDVNGRNVSSNSSDQIIPESGKDLILTIDRRIQILAEKALGPRNGSVVVLRPSTGEILAMVSYPYFDPNKFYTEEASQEFTRLQTDSTFPLMNRSIQSAYPPGSTFKIIMTTAILGDKVLDPNRTVVCTGSVEVGDRVFKCNKLTGHGVVNLAKALAQSCNIYFYKAGLENLGIERIDDYSNKFGLGQLTGVDIPGEIAGLVPTRKWKERNLNYPWLGGDTVNISIGQGYLQVTPIQMANAVAMISNMGRVYRPHLVKSVLDPLTKKVEETQPEIISENPLTPEIWTQVQNNMRGVITEGTAAVVITTKAVKVAGKTGTAEDGGKGSSNHSWFVAYAPWDDPNPDNRIVLAVQVEKTNEWEWWAPKAADMIFQGIFANQTYEEAIQTLKPWYISWQ
ncbi:MAG: penicillin-binding protein 2 [Spirochaetales bacterium]